MAAANGGEGPPLSEELLREPYRFDFFQAVRLLEFLARESALQDPRQPSSPVGRDSAPDREAVRFRVLPAQSFPSGAISQVRQPPPHGPEGPPSPVDVIVALLGLTGPQGVLPQHYTTLLLRRLREKDFALRDFLDLFNHRIISFFYRAWEKYRLPFAYERSQQRAAEGGGGEDACTRSLYCLVGLGTRGLRGRLGVADEAFLYYSGHFAHFPRSASALEGVLTDYFEMPVAVEQARGQWLILEEGDRSRLPGPGRPQGTHGQLNRSLIAGARVWDAQSKFRLRAGPLTYAQFRRYLPDGDGLRVLCQLTRAYVGPDLDFDVLLLLAPKEVPSARLSCRDPEVPRLGWNLWVRNRDFHRDVADAVFSVDAVESDR
jgi:type VI secretion system protein ImpH